MAQLKSQICDTSHLQPQAKHANAYIDVAMDRFTMDAAPRVPSFALFNSPSFTTKDEFPCDSNLGNEEPVFFTKSGSRLMEIVASSCGEAMAIGLAREATA